MIAQFLESRGASRRSSRIQVQLLAAALLLLVMALEWFSKLEYSLGVFYAIPVVIAATVLNRWQTLLAALFCAWARSWFTPPLPPIEFGLRFLMALLAYGGLGMLVSEMSRNRRAILAAYARLKMEENLRMRAEDSLRILVESSPAAIVTLNQRVEVLAANKAAHEIFGFEKPGSLIGVSLAEFVPVFAGAVRVSAPGRPIRVSSTSWAKRANGTHFPAAVWFSTYEENGETRLAAIVVDTSEEVREREHKTFRHLADSNRLLAGAVAHEIRNMCSAIRVVTSNMKRHPQVAQDADFGALVKLVESLMRISSFELSNAKNQLASRVDITRVLEELRVVIEPDWSDIGGEIDWEVDGVLPYVHADEHAMVQVFLNLSQNSLRAVQRGGDLRLTIRACTANGQATIAFEDSGPGIDDPSKLFHPFRENSDGSGLGLYVSRAMLRGFGGDLTYVPQSCGARFDVTLSTYQREAD